MGHLTRAGGQGPLPEDFGSCFVFDSVCLGFGRKLSRPGTKKSQADQLQNKKGHCYPTAECSTNNAAGLPERSVGFAVKGEKAVKNN